MTGMMARCRFLVAVVLFAAALAMVGGGGAGTSITCADAQYLTPAFHVGEVVPVRVYLRVRRQTRGIMNYITGGDAEDALPAAGDEVGEEQKAYAEAAVKGADRLGAEYVLNGLEGVGSKHANQVRRMLPQRHSPRFGISKHVRLPANATMKAAAEQLLRNRADAESDAALRFTVDKGLARETTWLPFATRSAQLQYGDLAMLLDQSILAQIGEQARAPGRKGGAPGEGDDTVFYLHKVTMYFGFQVGVMNRLTSLRFQPSYTTTRPDEITLQYVWDEHRAFNPHRAITVCCATAIVAAMAVALLVVSQRSGRASKHFRRRTVVVRTPS